MERRGARTSCEAIVQEALALVREGGEGAVTMRQLAVRLGYAPATLYLHFAGKEDLLAEVAEAGFRELLDRSEAALGKPDAAAALEAGARAYARFALQEPALYRVMFREGEGPRGGEAGAARARLWSLWRDVYARAGAGAPGADPETRTLLAWSLLHGLAALAMGRAPWVPAPGRPIDDAARERLVGRAAELLTAA